MSICVGERKIHDWGSSGSAITFVSIIVGLPRRQVVEVAYQVTATLPWQAEENVEMLIEYLQDGLHERL